MQRATVPKARAWKQGNELALDNIKAQIISTTSAFPTVSVLLTAEMVRNAYQGIGGEYETLLKAFRP